MPVIFHILFLFYMICFAVVFFMLFRIYDLVADKLLNDAKTQMTEQMYSILRQLGNKTEEERALWAYFRDKLHDVHHAYLEVKNSGLQSLNNESFRNSLLGSATTDAKKFGHLPENLIRMLDAFNEKHYIRFKDRLILDVAGIKRRRDFVTALRSNTVTSFADNVSEIYELYKEIKMKRNYALITSETLETDTLSIENKVSLSKTKLKTLVALNKISETLEILKSFSTDTDTTNEIIQQQARYVAVLKNNRITGETQKEELNKITNAILQIIDNF